MEYFIHFLGLFVDNIGLPLSILLFGLLPIYIYSYFYLVKKKSNKWVLIILVCLSLFLVFWFFSIQAVLQSGI